MPGCPNKTEAGMNITITMKCPYHWGSDMRERLEGQLAAWGFQNIEVTEDDDE